jgi:DNA topoisomerase-1
VEELVIKRGKIKKNSDMSKNLVLVESPAKSKTINKYLGSGFDVEPTMGHMVDLPGSKMGVDVKDDFKPTYEVLPQRRKTLSQIKKKAKKAGAIYLACDPDREGEAIAWHVSNQIKNNKKILRVVFSEITKEAVKEAFDHPRPIDIKLVRAQQARRILDRIVGYSLSPILWRKVSKGLSAGRVQSVAVRLVVDREREIEKFVPKEYWELEADLKKRLSDSGRNKLDEDKFTARLEKFENKKIEIKNKDKADRILNDLKRAAYVVKNVKKSKKRRKPQAPFTTSKMQQEAFNKLGFPVSRTMRIAQDLYEGLDLGDEGSVGLITYMRTDSVNISKQAQGAAKDYILKEFGKEYYPANPNVYKSKKGAQEAHEAIRPTLPLREPASVKKYLNDTQYKLYNLVWNRFLSSQMTPSQYSVVSVDIEAAKYLFRASGSNLVFDGYLKMYGKDDSQSENSLPHLKVGEELDLIKLKPSQHFTKPPARYSDASLVKALEEKGIGRPSTYAPIIYTIVMRNYVKRLRGYLQSTELGTMVTDLLMEHFPKIMDIGFTAAMEEELDEIEEGKIDWVKVLKDFYRPFQTNLDKAIERLKHFKKISLPTDQKCEKCGKPMVIKWGRHGKFLSCSDFPNCRFAKTITTGVKCPREGCEGELVERRSSRGTFYGCTKYPKCTYTARKLPEEDKDKRDNPDG